MQGIAGKLGKIISSNVMTKLLKKEQRGVIAQLCSLEVLTSKSSISPDLKKVLDNHSKVFETPKGLPPIPDHDHYSFESRTCSFKQQALWISLCPKERNLSYDCRNVRGWYNST